MSTPSPKRRKLTKLVFEVVVPTWKQVFRRKQKEEVKIENYHRTDVSNSLPKPSSIFTSVQVKHEDEDLALDLSIDDPPLVNHASMTMDSLGELKSVYGLPELPLAKLKGDLDDVSTLLRPGQTKQLVVDETESEKLAKMFKSKAKKHEEMRLSDDVFLQRVRPLGEDILDGFPVTLEREFRDQMVPRKFMSSVYGGSSQMTFPKPRPEKIAEHGHNDFMCLPLDYQPFAPQVPGKPGLFLSTQKGPDFHEPKRLFTRDALKAVWQYMGQFEGKSTFSLSKEEWLAQSDKVRNTWGREITRQGWGVYVCARIQARKELRRGAQFTQAKLDDVIKSKRYTRTTPEDVIAAYDSGVERLGVWTLKCIGYEADFQVDLCRKFVAWNPPAKPKREQKALPKRKSGVKREAKGEKDLKREVKEEVTPSESLPTRSSRGKKRKRAATPESEADDDDEPWAAPTYRPTLRTRLKSS